MRLWHRHRWEEVRRYPVPSRIRGHAKISAETASEYRKAVDGYTVVELRCVKCGDVSHRELPGVPS